MKITNNGDFGKLDNWICHVHDISYLETYPHNAVDLMNEYTKMDLSISNELPMTPIQCFLWWSKS